MWQECINQPLSFILLPNPTWQSLMHYHTMQHLCFTLRPNLLCFNTRMWAAYVHLATKIAFDYIISDLRQFAIWCGIYLRRNSIPKQKKLRLTFPVQTARATHFHFQNFWLPSYWRSCLPYQKDIQSNCGQRCALWSTQPAILFWSAMPRKMLMQNIFCWFPVLFGWYNYLENQCGGGGAVII